MSAAAEMQLQETEALSRLNEDPLRSGPRHFGEALMPHICVSKAMDADLLCASDHPPCSAAAEHGPVHALPHPGLRDGLGDGAVHSARSWPHEGHSSAASASSQKDL